MSDDRKSDTDGQDAQTPLPPEESVTLKMILSNGQAVKAEDGTVHFLDRRTGIEAKDYYHGLLPSTDIKKLLKKKGDFCIRIAEIEAGQDRDKCLCVRWDKFHTFVLKMTENKQWSLDMDSPNSRQFARLEDMIEHYVKSKQPFSPFYCELRNPIGHKDWEFHHPQVELLSKLGEGAFGEVYSGYVCKGNRLVAAIKTVKCDFITKDKIDEVTAEARVMRRLEHPNIVKFFGIAADEEPLMVLMELVEGGSLDKHLKENNVNISLEDRVKMCTDAASGLSYLHAENILHRDIAARNCLYAKACLKICDFGMSKKGTQYEVQDGDRAPYRWMSPEVFKTRIHTPASDVWALGVLFYEIFCNGKEPYRGWNSGQIKHQLLSNNYRLSLPDWAPAAMKELLKKMWNAEPLTRISAEEVARTMNKMSLSANPKMAGKLPSSSGSNDRRPKQEREPSREKNRKSLYKEKSVDKTKEQNGGLQTAKKKKHKNRSKSKPHGKGASTNKKGSAPNPSNAQSDATQKKKRR